MLSSSDFALKSESGEDLAQVTVIAGLSSADTATGKAQNNYVRPAGQVRKRPRSARNIFDQMVHCRTSATF